MAQKVWRGYITFGMLSIPSYLHVAARDEHIGLSWLHNKCKGRIRMPRTCETCERAVPQEEIISAYKTPADEYIPLSKEEIDSITPASEKTLEITETVRWCDVDAVYLAESFYLLPEAPGLKAYSLLVKALQESGRVAIGQLCKSNREHIALIRPRGDTLMVHFLFYDNEVHRVPEFESFRPASISPAEVKLALKLIDTLSGPFSPEQYENGYEQRLNTLIASKMDSKIKAPAAVKAATQSASVDIMAALQASIDRPRPKRKIALDEEQPIAKGKKAKRAA